MPAVTVTESQYRHATFRAHHNTRATSTKQQERNAKPHSRNNTLTRAAFCGCSGSQVKQHKAAGHNAQGIAPAIQQMPARHNITRHT
jgi:hypothetical protein